MENCFSLIQGWIVECSAQHSQCVVTNAFLSKRLLNIRQAGSQPRLEHTTEHQKGQYIFLSYNWRVSNFIRTTRENLLSFMQGIPLDSFPKTFQDAIYLARKLGISYLYIDVLCIIQDEVMDWEVEVKKLHRYAAGAWCVFSPMSHDLETRLFPERDDGDELLSLKLQSSDSDYIQIRRPLQTLDECLPDCVSSGAWRLQEIVLSPRILFFHHDQVFWNCNTCLRSEGSLVATQRPVLRLAIDATSTLQFDIAQRNHLMPWYSFIELFSQTRLAHVTDALPALVGIARNVEDKLHLHYLAGIWREDLARGLLWKGQTKYSLTRPSEYVAPSCSCVSLLGPVSYSFARAISSLSPQAAPRFDTVAVVLSQDRYSVIDFSKDNYIVLSAMILQLSCGDPLDHLECFFDLVEDEKAFLEGSKKYFCVIIARHCLDITDKGSRYIGLLVTEMEEQNDLMGTTRIGIFVGPSLDSPLDNWARRQVRIF